MRARDLAQKLTDQIDSVVRHLLPAGKQQGNEWCVGSIQGDPGRSLKVNVSGPKVGVWADFAAGNKGGDLLDLWQAVHNCDLPEAMRQAASYLGLADHPRPTREKEIQHQPPYRPKTMVPIKEAPAALDYMTRVRGITPAILELFRVGGDRDTIYFPFFWAGQPALIKQLKISRRNGKKEIRPTSKNQLKCLYGWQALTPNARQVIICEGEINAMSIRQMGMDALSVPFGAGSGAKQDWVETEYDNLDRYDIIYLWFDNDEAGQAAIPELVGRLGPERCRVIESPVDANDQLRRGMTRNNPVDGVTLRDLLTAATEQTPAALGQMIEYRDAIWADICDPYAWERGYRLPWRSAGTQFVFRAGEVTILSGVNGDGKSAQAGQIVVAITDQGGVVGVASMESKPEKWLTKMIKQYHALYPWVGGERPLTEQPTFDKVFAALNQKILAYHCVGQGKTTEMLEVFRYTRRRYGATFFLIDNLSALDVGLDDYELQRQFIQKIVAFAKTENVHVLLVAHQRKPGDNSAQPGTRFGIKGSGALSDLVDNSLICWRNRAKEKKIREGAAVDPGSPDTLLICDKQRETGAEPVFKLWFRAEAAIFLPAAPQAGPDPEPYPPDWDNI